MIIKSPGILLSSVYFIMSYTSLIFSPIYLPLIDLAWSLEIRVSRIVFDLLAIVPDASLLVTFKSVYGLRCFQKMSGFVIFRYTCDYTLFLSNWHGSRGKSIVEASHYKVAQIFPKHLKKICCKTIWSRAFVMLHICVK